MGLQLRQYCCFLHFFAKFVISKIPNDNLNDLSFTFKQFINNFNFFTLALGSLNGSLICNHYESSQYIWMRKTLEISKETTS